MIIQSLILEYFLIFAREVVKMFITGS